MVFESLLSKQGRAKKRKKGDGECGKCSVDTDCTVTVLVTCPILVCAARASSYVGDGHRACNRALVDARGRTLVQLMRTAVTSSSRREQCRAAIFVQWHRAGSHGELDVWLLRGSAHLQPV